jgi:hypothetical protein
MVSGGEPGFIENRRLRLHGNMSLRNRQQIHRITTSPSTGADPPRADTRCWRLLNDGARSSAVSIRRSLHLERRRPSQVHWCEAGMPVVFLFSAMVSGIALVMLLYMLLTWLRKQPIDVRCVEERARPPRVGLDGAEYVAPKQICLQCGCATLNFGRSGDMGCLTNGGTVPHWTTQYFGLQRRFRLMDST